MVYTFNCSVYRKRSGDMTKLYRKKMYVQHWNLSVCDFVQKFEITRFEDDNYFIVKSTDVFLS